MKVLRWMGRAGFAAAVLGAGANWLGAQAMAGATRSYSADVAIYGATPAGLAAAREIARSGRSVVLIEPTGEIGGMVTGGISSTDTGNTRFVGGIAREFFKAVEAEERSEAPPKPVVMKFQGGEIPWAAPENWALEPHVAQAIFAGWVREQKDRVLLRRSVAAVSKKGAHIEAVRLTDGTTVRAREWIDASYEGDLMARAGVRSTYGRESEAQYGESMAGIRKPHFVRYYTEAEYATPSSVFMHHGQFGAELKARNAAGRLLWGVEPGPLGTPGTGDSRLQAYCYRLAVTQRPDLKLPWPKPVHYDAAHYELLLHYVEAHPGISFTRLVNVAPVPNGKWDLNASGPFSVDFIGGNRGFPAESYAGRRAAEQAHKEYEQGFLWFLAHDPHLPQHLRDEVNSWGPARDEWADNGHWPPQLYIREARRMVGAYVMTEHDILEEKTKPDSIGMGSFVLDSHWVRRFEDEHGNVRVEGNLDESINLAEHPYEIPYRAITPKQEEAENLLVPVCLSATHVALGTIRMEPVYMILGQAAGRAAVQALKEEKPVQAIDMETLRKALEAEGAVLNAREQQSAD